MGHRYFLMLHDASHISDTRLCTLRSGRTRLHSAGQERSDIVRDGTGTVFNLIVTRGNGTGMDLSQRDGTVLVMIFIPLSLSKAGEKIMYKKPHP